MRVSGPTSASGAGPVAPLSWSGEIAAPSSAFDVPTTTDSPKARAPRARSLTAVHAAWCVGPRRVAIACAEDSRPAACCVVDALVARGYDAELRTGADAKSALRRDGDDPGRLRVLWLPDHGAKATKDALRRALDPDGMGDVLVLASPTPRGVIEAIEAFAAGKERPRSRSGPRRTYLDHPTRCESTVDVKGFMGATLAAAAATAAVLLAIRFGSDMMQPPEPRAATAQLDGQATPSRPARRAVKDEPVLGNAIAPLDEPAILDDEPPVPDVVHERSRSRTRAPERREAAEIDEAPLEDVVTVAAPEPVVLAPATSPALARPRTATIDPFE